jgi:hypothetical protein
MRKTSSGVTFTIQRALFRGFSKSFFGSSFIMTRRITNCSGCLAFNVTYPKILELAVISCQVYIFIILQIFFVVVAAAAAKILKFMTRMEYCEFKGFTMAEVPVW